MNKILLYCSAIILLLGCYSSDPHKSGKEGQLLPNFSLLLTDSATRIHTSTAPSGQPITFFYLNPHCPYCRAQTKTIIENIDKLKNIQFYFVSNFDISSLKAFYKEHQLAKYPNIILGMDSANVIGDYFEVPGVPYLAIYGKDKIMKKAFLGKIYSNQIRAVSEE